MIALSALLILGAWMTGVFDFGGEEEALLALPEGPKIVVLPVNNLSDDPGQAFFTDDLTEDLTTRLTDHGWLFVIARNCAYAYAGKDADPWVSDASAASITSSMAACDTRETVCA